MMFPQTNRSELRTVWVLVFYLLLRRFCEGQSNLTGTSQTIKAMHGDGVILPCYVKPAMDVTGLTLEWTIPDLERRFVYVWRDGVEFVGKKHKSFTGRTTLFTDELKQGNISLKLSKVRISDRGKFRCFIPQLGKEFIVQLDVGAVSSPVLSLSGLHRDRGAVEFRCESGGWYPEPEVLWLDSEGKLLSAGPTETVRGPDDLYTVSSRLTVENRLSNSFTCRVHQNHTNQTRDTHITVTDEFYKDLSSSVDPVVIAVVVGILLLLLPVVLFVVWKRRQSNARKSHNDEEPQRDAQQTPLMKGETDRELKAVSGFISVEKVDLNGRFVVLQNVSAKDQQLEGFEIHIRVDDRKPIIYTFNKFILTALNKVTVWASGCAKTGAGSNLVWSNQNPWVPTDKLQVTVFSSSGEEISTKCEKNITPENTEHQNIRTSGTSGLS